MTEPLFRQEYPPPSPDDEAAPVPPPPPDPLSHIELSKRMHAALDQLAGLLDDVTRARDQRGSPTTSTITRMKRAVSEQRDAVQHFDYYVLNGRGNAQTKAQRETAVNYELS